MKSGIIYGAEQLVVIATQPRLTGWSGQFEVWLQRAGEPSRSFLLQTFGQDELAARQFAEALAAFLKTSIADRFVA